MPAPLAPSTSFKLRSLSPNMSSSKPAGGSAGREDNVVSDELQQTGGRMSGHEHTEAPGSNSVLDSPQDVAVMDSGEELERQRSDRSYTMKFLYESARRESVWAPAAITSTPTQLNGLEPKTQELDHTGDASHVAVRKNLWGRAIPTIRALTSMSLRQRSGKSSSSIGRRINIYPTANDAQDVVPEEEEWPDGIIHPTNRMYSTWWTVTVIASAVTALTVPVDVAFYQSYSGDSWFSASFLSMSWVILEVVFLVDMAITFRLAYVEGLRMVTSKRMIAMHYLKGLFVVDLLAVFPYEFLYSLFGRASVLTTATGMMQPLAIVRTSLPLFRMLRTYRLFTLFTSEHYNTELPFTLSTLVRNYIVVLLWTHFSACMMFYIAAVEGFGSREWGGANMLPDGTCIFPDGSPATTFTWLGGPCSQRVGTSLVERYTVSIYWAIITMTTVGYGDYSPLGPTGTAWTIVYILINIGLNAYVLGGITLISVKDDADVVAYRGKSKTLAEYMEIHEIPKDIAGSMEAHLRLHFANEEASDQDVLSIFPATLRRNILRYIYKGRLQNSYLYQGCSIKFLDLLVAAADFDLFMPQVDLVKYGKLVTELMMLIEGEMRCAYMEDSDVSPEDQSNDGWSDVKVESVYAVAEGELLGEVAFFTEAPAQETVSTVTVCRIMVISRTAWNHILERHCSGAERMLENLNRGAAEALEDSGAHSRATSGTPSDPVNGDKPVNNKTAPFPQTNAFPPHTDSTTARHLSSKSQQPFWSRRLSQSRSRRTQRQCSSDPHRPGETSPATSPTTLPSVFSAFNHTQVEETGEKLGLYVQRQHDAITGQLLQAAAEGDMKCIRNLLGQGIAIDRQDYAGRTALFFAIAHTRTEALHTLLLAGAQVNLTSPSYGTPLLFACHNSASDDVIDMLLQFNARLGLTETQSASELSRAVMEGDIRLLRRLLRCNVRPGAKACDSRTALHVAAAGGFPAAVDVLLRAGCPPNVQDRWGSTPLDDARRSNNMAVLVRLQAHLES